jgi:hypothetical protein
MSGAKQVVSRNARQSAEYLRRRPDAFEECLFADPSYRLGCSESECSGCDAAAAAGIPSMDSSFTSFLALGLPFITLRRFLFGEATSRQRCNCILETGFHHYKRQGRSGTTSSCCSAHCHAISYPDKCVSDSHRIHERGSKFSCSRGMYRVAGGVNGLRDSKAVVLVDGRSRDWNN